LVRSPTATSGRSSAGSPQAGRDRALVRRAFLQVVAGLRTTVWKRRLHSDAEGDLPDRDTYAELDESPKQALVERGYGQPVDELERLDTALAVETTSRRLTKSTSNASAVSLPPASRCRS
jgi:hypothetical protein